jgi:C-terminal processing protease CtpA/Prc
MAQRGFGITRVQRLAGNIGYLDIRGFFPTEFAAPAISAAMTLLSGTDALIIDLRSNGGGEPETVAYLLSHFFAEGDARHLNDIYNRLDGTTRSYWTVPSVGARYTPPIFVLTSHNTFSGGEEFAYDVKTQKRGTLVGEVTGGGANPGDYIPLARGFIAFIPTGRAINPITRTNWEHVGVTPDVAAPAADAMRLAYSTALKAVAAKASDAEERQELADTAARAERGEIELPKYEPRH